MRAIMTVMATLGILGVVTASGPARAHDDDGDWRRQEWQEHRWRSSAGASTSGANAPGMPMRRRRSPMSRPATTSPSQPTTPLHRRRISGPAWRLLYPCTAASHLPSARGFHRL